jgi:glucosamine 6-phosphate synthetase-like amidotransferase/phosphosugar isomerase protein
MVRRPSELVCFVVLHDANGRTGLSRLEYRGYDSAGLAVDGDKRGEVFAFKEVGKVAKLKDLIEQSKPDMTKVFESHVGIAHTRWASHGKPSRLNCHPHRCWMKKPPPNPLPSPRGIRDG